MGFFLRRRCSLTFSGLTFSSRLNFILICTRERPRRICDAISKSVPNSDKA